jgi:V/A-type H+-transporting ATPase subunit K
VFRDNMIGRFRGRGPPFVGVFGKLYDARRDNYEPFGDHTTQPMYEIANALADMAVLQQEGLDNRGMAALAVGLAALGAGYAERGIGAAAMGAIAEDRDLFVPGIVLTVLPETLVIFAIVIIFLVV